MKLKNKYYILRHGEALSNVRDIVSSWPEKFENHLTNKGKKTIKESAEKLKDKNINLIFSSDLLRTRQTAEIVGKKLKIKPKLDKRLREINFGVFSGGSIEKMWNYFKGEEERIKKAPAKGESYPKILKRMMSFLKDTDKKYKGKNILIISHEGPLFLLQGKVMGFFLAETIKKFTPQSRIHKGEIRELN
jgi:broad specificity phosphatase PhoE